MNTASRPGGISFSTALIVSAWYGFAQAQEAPPSRPANAGDLAASRDATTVVVTARKREESITDVPVAVTSFSEQSLRDYNIRSFADYATKTPNLSFAYGNGTSAGETGTGFANARTIAIRGIAGARTTGFYIDDTPLPGAVDPRVVDLFGIEVLKGPQGTLFGESSLGGNVRLITKAPNLQQSDFRYMVTAGHTENGGVALNSGAEAVGNWVLAPGRAALRWVAFGDDTAGYLARSYLANISDPDSARIRIDNQGALRNYGGSITALLRISDDLDLTLRLMHQNQQSNGMAATYAPLPDFKPVVVLEHTADIQPEANEVWTVPSIVLTYRGEGWTLNSSTSQFSREATDLEDSTEGTAQYLLGKGHGAPPAQGFAWSASRRSEQFAHETRVTFEPVNGWSGTLGLFHATLDTDRQTPPTYGQDVLGVAGRTMMWVYSDQYRQQDTSVFGELYYTFAGNYALTLGNRRYWLKQRDHSHWDGALYGAYLSDTQNSSGGNNPKLAISYKPDSHALIYASASKGFRAGGAQGDISSYGCVSAAEAARLARVDSDSLWSYELGGKLDLPDPGLLLTGALYRIDWSNIQQPAFVPACAFYLLGNAGAARIDGAELELSGRLQSDLKIRLGLGYEDARISEQGSSQHTAGSRIKQIPRWTASLGMVYNRPLNDRLMGFVSGDYSYTGDSVSANSTSIDLIRPGYGLLNARAGVSWNNAELSLAVSNLANTRPNLGDVGYLGYMRFVSGTTTPLPQVATLPTRTVTLQYRERF